MYTHKVEPQVYLLTVDDMRACLHVLEVESQYPEVAEKLKRLIAEVEEAEKPTVTHSYVSVPGVIRCWGGSP